LCRKGQASGTRCYLLLITYPPLNSNVANLHRLSDGSVKIFEQKKSAKIEIPLERLTRAFNEKIIFPPPCAFVIEMKDNSM